MLPNTTVTNLDGILSDVSVDSLSVDRVDNIEPSESMESNQIALRNNNGEIEIEGPGQEPNTE